MRPTWPAAGSDRLSVRENPRVTTLRLLSYNVRSLRDDTDAVVRVIRAATPDVVCIQEAPRLLRWRARCAALARRSGLIVVTGGRPAGANLLLSTVAVAVETARSDTFSRESAGDVRGTALAVLRLRAARFAVAGIHLGLRPESRRSHVAQLHELLDRVVPEAVPSIVAGDVNDEPGSATWQALAEGRTDAWTAGGSGTGDTYSATRPAQRIDGVFVDSRCSVRTASVLDGPDVEVGSDHRPLLVEVELPD